MLDKINVAAVHVHLSDPDLSNALDNISAVLSSIQRNMKMNQDQLAAALEAAAAQTNKIIAEVQVAVATLQAEVAASGQASPAVEAALASLQTALNAADALNPDAAVAPDGGVIAP